MASTDTEHGLRLPPILSGHCVPAGLDVLTEAVAGARSQRLGAADCLWSASQEEAAFAIVLEPDVDFETALQVGVVMFAAIADSLGVTMPPKTGVFLRWPRTLIVNGAAAGEILFDVADRPAGAPLDAGSMPDWLVVGARLSLRRHASLDAAALEPGCTPEMTTLFEEGAGDLDRSTLIQSSSAHFLTWLNRWQDDGFKPVHDAVIGRIEARAPRQSSAFDATESHHQGSSRATPHETQSDGSCDRDVEKVLGLSADASLIVALRDGSHTAIPFYPPADRPLPPGDSEASEHIGCRRSFEGTS